MSGSLLHRCRHHGCPALVPAGFCPAHERARQQSIDDKRRNFRERGYTSRWDKLRLWFLARNQLCVDPFQEHGKQLVLASVVDHKIPHKGDQFLMWDERNLQSLCAHCHNRKTANENRNHLGRFAS